MFKKLKLAGVCLFIFTNFAFALNENRTVKIIESQDAGIYTYIKVEEKGEKYWAAIPKTVLKKGQTITIKSQVWMKNFKSTTLNKTFDKVLFADFSKKAIISSDDVHKIHGDMIKKKAENFKPNPKFNEGLVISKAPAIKTSLAKLYKNKNTFKNKNVEIHGKVIQVSNKVMGNTWIKIQNGEDAIIFRSPNEDEKVKIGDNIKVTGTINTDVDYGYGFAYKIIGVNGKFTILN